MIITVNVNPRSRFERVEKIDAKSYRVSFNVSPKNGRANSKLIELLSGYFNVSKSNIIIRLGKASTEKVVEIKTD